MEVQINDKSSVSSPQSKRSKKGCIIAAIAFLVIGGVASVCAVFAALATTVDSTWPSSTQEVVREGSESKIAVINVRGVITEDVQSGGFSTTSSASSRSIVANLEDARSDPTVKAILLHIESPGGEVAASDIIYNKVREVREEKPVIAYSSTMAASGGYYIASGADKFVIHPSSITGSIGVILQATNIDGLYEKLGIDSVTFKSGRFKDDSELFDGDPNGEIESIYNDILDEAYDEFVGSIVEGREMDESKVRELGDGRVYTGKQAVKNGLADRNGYFDDAIAEAETLAGEQNMTVVEYRSNGFLGGLLGYFGFLDKIRSSGITDFGIKTYYLLDLK